ncbi:MAG: hypothetical protein PHZ03_02120 [Syntrophomonas sp.]|nr:hypothetical protein [Syntrophomonas sp.]
MGEEQKRSEDLSLEIRMMKPEDAPGVVELYKSVYGDEYPVKAVYDAKDIIRQQENGDVIRIICRSSEGRVIGHVATFRSCLSNPALYEEGQGIVLPQFRNQGIIRRCMIYLNMEIYPQMMEQLWGEAVCNHVFVQKAEAQLGWYDTGLEVDLMPAASYIKEQSSEGRVSALLMFKSFKIRAQTVYLPEIYEDSLRYLYSVYDFGHTFLPARASLPNTPTSGLSQIFQGAGVARFTITELGSDFEKYFLQQEREALDKDTCILQVYLNLASPANAAAIEILRRHQYYLGGILPRWFDTDGLLMQKTINPPGFAHIKLHSEGAVRIQAIIEADYKSVIEGEAK